MPNSPLLFFDSFGGNDFPSSWRFGDYVKTVAAIHPGEVIGVLKQVEQATADGLFAAGFIAYEAATALNRDLPALPSVAGLPLVWFAIFRERHEVEGGAHFCVSSADATLEPLKDLEQYTGDIERIRDYIAAGDCYQINHTFPLHGVFQGSLQGLYSCIGAAQRAPFCAYLDIGRFTILSASPELFFSLREGIITTRPMKGTSSRGRWSEEDLSLVAQLRGSPKERAENLMIVDLLRNDLGIVAETGSVSVDALFEVETYPTVHQMTSTVSAKLNPDIGLTEVLQALFPCGSVTGAPKRRSMEIIGELENAPRGVYCGAIGCVAPGGEALFSVAIRTLLFDADTHKLTMGVGSAVTWDSEVVPEYAECLSKGDFLYQPEQEFKLIESLRLEKGTYTHLERHIARLAASAQYFRFSFSEDRVRHMLSDFSDYRTERYKVRLLLSADGSLELSSDALDESVEVLHVCVSSVPVHSGDRFRYHKTTRRNMLDSARSNRPDCDEVLLLNEYGQVTEGSYHNLVIKLGGLFVTPPLACGLLPGVLRAELLETGKISEQVLYPRDLESAEEIWLINSVRGWRRCELKGGMQQ
ncbi:MAG: aminodeoxychorismate synthase component I [Desulfuromonadaceae bacterium]|nr:aminodeoxychorismate synthase component I [Desulfuromonadaceae bacterium]MDD5104012.1 aminodeoxychorismate synthase component I [Desulfuromonadaceae bacterium]